VIVWDEYVGRPNPGGFTAIRGFASSIAALNRSLSPDDAADARGPASGCSSIYAGRWGFPVIIDRPDRRKSARRKSSFAVLGASSFTFCGTRAWTQALPDWIGRPYPRPRR